jgi:hypothetical protein
VNTGVYRTEPLLKDRFIFLSASKPSRDLYKFPLASRKLERTSVEIEEAVVSLARAVFSYGGRLVFGGHPSISPLVASVAAEYFPARHIAKGREPVWIYQSKAFQRVIADSTRTLEDLGYARIHWIDRFVNEEFQSELAGEEQCLESLGLMREALIHLQTSGDLPAISPPQTPLAMVAIGGMEGVVREARLFLERTTSPIYALRSTAGASAKLVPYLRDNVVRDSTPMRMIGWESRISILEDLFPIPNRKYGAAAGSAEDKAEAPLASYAVLMQRMIMRLCGKEPLMGPV